MTASEDIAVRHSDSLGKLAEALAAAQGEFDAVTKDRTAKIESQKGGYSYSYADLASILESARKHLSKHGLAVLQPIAWAEGHPWLLTRLVHSSGEWIESVYPLATYDRPQEMGSAITYARRYAICALLGIAAEEDDDGATAQRGTPSPSRPSAPRAPAGPKVECPHCGGSAGASKFPKAGATHYCRECGAAFEPKATPPEQPAS